jgi:hypothetical protein
MVSRREALVGIGVATGLAGCVEINVDDPREQGETQPSNGGNQQPSEPVEQEPTATERRNEPTASFTSYNRDPLEGYAVTVTIEVGAAKEIGIIHNDTIIERLSQDGNERLMPVDEKQRGPAEFGDRLAAVAVWEDKNPTTIEDTRVA